MTGKSPNECGEADAYYSRRPIPHKEVRFKGKAHRIETLTKEERLEYWNGYNDAGSGKKDWG